MPVVFPRKGNPLWPLPADYQGLSKDGQRRARVNAVQLGGRPDLEEASWQFVRKEYLYPTPKGMFYDHGVVGGSPGFHAEWVRFFYSNPITALEAPRGTCKSVVQRELAVRNLLRPYYKTIGFYSGMQKITENFDIIMVQLSENSRIIDDFGKLKPPKGSGGTWNHHYLKLRNGAMLLGIPIKGASLGGRPNEVYFDDVEKTDELIETPSEHIDKYRDFVMSVVLPMATSAGMWVRMVNTAYSHRTFSHWVQTTNDTRIQKWGRRIDRAYWDHPETGERTYLWPQYLTPEFLEQQIQLMGYAKFSANYLNTPTTDADRILVVHPQLNTYTTPDADGDTIINPFASRSRVRSSILTGYDGKTPKSQEITRPWAHTLSGMRRFLMVDQATSVSTTSDFSAVHAMGIENSEQYRDTLWSLDGWMGKVRPEELVRRIYQMAIRWQVAFVGIEAYALQTEFYERMAHDLPGMFQPGEFVPRVLPIKFPPKFEKADKIKALEWRFLQYRLKLPTDRGSNPFYRALFYQIENFTEDLELLPHDDALDTLAMHLAVGKIRAAPTGPDIRQTGVDLLGHLRRGEFVDDELGISVLSGLNFSDIPDDVLREMYDKRLEEAEAEYGQETADMVWHPSY